jgi:hypothetical protein
MADNDFIYLPTNPDSPYPTGRSVVWHDPRNRLHRAKARGVEGRKWRSKRWSTTDIFNQIGSSCTVQSAVGCARTTPNRRSFLKFWKNYDTEQKRFEAYLRTQTYDPWEGGEPDYEGSSTDAALKMLREEGAISGWKWLFGVDELREWVMYDGPASIGTIWYPSMFYPDANGVMHIDEAPQEELSGHAYRVVGYRLRQRQFIIANSWGCEWGVGGFAYIPDEMMCRLLAEQGEAATIVS